MAAHAQYRRGSIEGMDESPPSKSEAVDARRVALIMAELSYDLQRAVKSGVPAVLRDSAADLEPERLASIAERILKEIGARYHANAMATIAIIDP